MKHLTLRDLERAARTRLDPMALRYYSSGADDQRTLRRNRAAFGDYALWPRVLVDVERPRIDTTVLGVPVALPVLIAPTAYQRLAHPEGELATARAAAAAGTVMVLSTLSTVRLEDVVSGPRWFQLYVHKDRGLTRSLVERAVAAGYGALVLTVDTPVLGRRLGDERHGFTLPAGLEMANLTSDPTFDPPEGSRLAAYVASRFDPTLSWRDLEWLASLSRLPIVVKGVLRGDDARLAVQHGAAAVLVSNHGGRQLDGVPATLDALPDVVDAVGGDAEVYLDGGVRWGTDVVKALALGARAVLVGRPVLWGLAVGGEAGVTRVLDILREELIRAMQLLGSPDLTHLGEGRVRAATSPLRG